MSREARRVRRSPSSQPGVEVRRVAIAALVRIFEHGAYANLVLPQLIERAGLSARDRALVTELVYGTTRRRRSCDWLVDRFLLREVDPEVRAALAVGAYQLAFTKIPDHAAVAATVAAVKGQARGFVNAVLRRVATAATEWPDDATRLSYPDWIVERLDADLGREASRAALEAMNQASPARVREDGYVQDQASQWVAELVEAGPGELVADLCAAPGGKATWMARSGARVLAMDRSVGRLGLLHENLGRSEGEVHTLVGDACAPPLREESFDRVLIDAPCSGLGVLRRRPDARWRVAAEDVERLAELQGRMARAALALLGPGGVLVYSVCTLTAAETLGVDELLARLCPELEPLPPPPGPWLPHGRGAMLLPQAAGTDGMMVLRLRRSG